MRGARVAIQKGQQTRAAQRVSIKGSDGDRTLLWPWPRFDIALRRRRRPGDAGLRLFMVSIRRKVNFPAMSNIRECIAGGEHLTCHCCSNCGERAFHNASNSLPHYPDRTVGSNFRRDGRLQDTDQVPSPAEFSEPLRGMERGSQFSLPVAL